ncbi:hypothetical protein [Pedobacter mendelii]|uniref:hypothetical protein n=1 Tax=Pedobacter mendelii TaxID=1908240 RepID=UPI00166409B0|nr:hypothetical protein [Pedobacter mendelii]
MNFNLKVYFLEMNVHLHLADSSPAIRYSPHEIFGAAAAVGFKNSGLLQTVKNSCN